MNIDKINELALKVMFLSRNMIIVNFRFFDIALNKLKYLPNSKSLEVDGKYIYYNPIYILNKYKDDKNNISHDILHMLFHCIFLHPFVNSKINKRYWNLACDIAVENIIIELDNKNLKIDNEEEKQNIIDKIKKETKYLVAEKIYRYLLDTNISETTLKKYEKLFKVDDHDIWYQNSKDNKKEPNNNSQKNNQIQDNTKEIWKNISDSLKVDLETFGKSIGDSHGELMQNLKSLTKEKYDYKEFLKRFSVLGETMKINDDEFDYIFYTYGMNLYQNMPLIEPLEYKEVKKIKEFVIAIDTSGSVNGELVQTFIKKTYNILKQQENFFNKINLHIIQCDTIIQEDVKITNQQEFDNYISSMVLKGFGGTDFRGVFEYVDNLIKKHEFTNLKGIIYFTDGYGIFPEKKPQYQAAFVFIKEDYDDVEVPVWAIKYLLQKDEIKEEDYEY